MTMPNTFNVADVLYTVKEREFIEINGNRNYQGLCDYHTTTIEVLGELPKNRKDEVLIHELLHAVFNEAGFDEQEEEVINRVARVLYQVLKNNDFSFLKTNPFYHPVEGSITLKNSNIIHVNGDVPFEK